MPLTLFSVLCSPFAFSLVALDIQDAPRVARPVTPSTADLLCEEKEPLSPPRVGTQIQLYGAQEKAVLIEFDKYLKRTILSATALTQVPLL